MRIFIATLGTETNTFASFPTGIEDFYDCFWNEGDIASAMPSGAPPRGITYGSPTSVQRQRNRNPQHPLVQSVPMALSQQTVL